jgi:hypothetical protein
MTAEQSPSSLEVVMSSVLDPPRSPAAPTRRPTVFIGVLIVVTAAALFLIIQRLNPSPSFVNRLTIVNPTPYQIDVETTGIGRSVSITVGSVPREQTKTFEDVLDQGEEWIFRFASAHHTGGEVRMTREDLVRGEWRVTIPSVVAERLAAAGASPSGRE